jgi:hypothetical protein
MLGVPSDVASGERSLLLALLGEDIERLIEDGETQDGD